MPIPTPIGEEAACLGHAELFFGPENEDGADRRTRESAAVQLCGRCPARRRCLDLAVTLGARDGIWGGLRESDRRPVTPARRAGSRSKPAARCTSPDR